MALADGVGRDHRWPRIQCRNESFLDIVDNPSSLSPFGGRAEVGYEKFAAFVDGFHADLSFDDLSGQRGPGDVDANLEQGIIDFGLMYRIGKWEPKGEMPRHGRSVSLDLYGGGRYAELNLKLDPERLGSRSSSQSWLDPIVGAKVVLPSANSWRLQVNGDIGGFGVSSNFTWSATGLIGFDFDLFGAPSSILVGYRAIAWDYSSGSGNSEFTYDVINHGPIIGLQVRF